MKNLGGRITSWETREVLLLRVNQLVESILEAQPSHHHQLPLLANHLQIHLRPLHLPTLLPPNHPHSVLQILESQLLRLLIPLPFQAQIHLILLALHPRLPLPYLDQLQLLDKVHLRPSLDRLVLRVLGHQHQFLAPRLLRILPQHLVLA